MVHTHPLLSSTDEVRLAHAIEAGALASALLTAESGPDAELSAIAEEGRRAWQTFVAANLRLAWSVAWPMARQSGLDAEELFQEGVVGLLEALHRYDHRRQARFATFALPWIRMRVSEAAATRFGALGLPPGRAKVWRQTLAESRRLTVALGRHSTERDIAEATGRSTVAVRRLLDFQPVDIVDAAALPGCPVVDHVAEGPSTLVLAVDALPTGEREVIALRYGFAGTPASTNEVAETLGVSRSTVRRREASALARLRERPDLLVAA